MVPELELGIQGRIPRDAPGFLLTQVHRPSTKYLQITLPFLSACWWGLSWSLRR